MIAFKYSKLHGAEFISHLDTLRHLNKTFARAGFKVKMSQGFHPHMLVYMSSPIGVGQKSLAEYCTVEVDLTPEEFIERFNENSPKGIKCIAAYQTDKNPNFAAVITCARYYIEGLNEFSIDEVLSFEEFFITDKNGNKKNVREKIFSIEKRGQGIVAVLAAGNSALRADAFAKTLAEAYGGDEIEIIKEESFLSFGVSIDTLFE